MLKLLFFGRLGDLSEQVEKQLPWTEQLSTPRQVCLYLQKHHRELGKALSQPRITVAINQQLAQWDSSLEDGDYLAFLPPVSGG